VRGPTRDRVENLRRVRCFEMTPTPPSAFARIASSSAAGVAPPNDPRCGENSPLWSPTTVTNSSAFRVMLSGCFTPWWTVISREGGHLFHGWWTAPGAALEVATLDCRVIYPGQSIASTLGWGTWAAGGEGGGGISALDWTAKPSPKKGLRGAQLLLQEINSQAKRPTLPETRTSTGCRVIIKLVQTTQHKI
jgi:hypothetical protein